VTKKAGRKGDSDIDRTEGKKLTHVSKLKLLPPPFGLNSLRMSKIAQVKRRKGMSRGLNGGQ
jgi:hypothetical protein